MIADCLSINEKNHLQIGGLDTVDLAKQYGTPLYVMDEEQIRNNCRLYKDAIDKFYDGNGLILYASKAFSCMHIYRVMMQEGLGIDVVSAASSIRRSRRDFQWTRCISTAIIKQMMKLSLL